MHRTSLTREKHISRRESNLAHMESLLSADVPRWEPDDFYDECMKWTEQLGLALATILFGNPPDAMTIYKAGSQAHRLGSALIQYCQYVCNLEEKRSDSD